MWIFDLLLNKKEKEFRATLRQRDTDKIEDLASLSSRERERLAVLKSVLKEQFGLSNLLLADNILENVPDFPLDEVLLETAEILGLRFVPDKNTRWDGTVLGIVKIMEDSICAF